MLYKSPAEWDSPNRPPRAVEEASPGRSSPLGEASSAGAALIKREKANSVAYGRATSYMAASPSMAPSAIALVAMRPEEG